MTADDWILAEKSSRAFEYVRYFGIVRTMPTYSSQPPGTWSGELRYDLCACDLLLTFGYDSKRTTLALWLFMTGYWLRSRAEHSTLLDGLELWEDISVWRAVLEKLSRTFYSPRRFGTMRRHLCAKNCFGDGTWGSHVVLYCKRIL